MLVGYVSDARYVALAEFGRDGEMVYYEILESGGAVFSVGSITYPSSLLVDAQISRITSNVITRFLAELGSR